MKRSRRIVRIALAFAGVGALALLGVRLYVASEVAAAGREIGQARFGAAKLRLTAVDVWWPGRPDVAYQLGVCERRLGRVDSALEAWRRVAPGSIHGGQAALAAADVLIERSRFADSEEVLKAALAREGPQAVELRQTLIRLFQFQARQEEVAALIEVNWGKTPDPFHEVFEHAALDLLDFPIDGVRSVLDHASRSAPDDDRVWLGRANLAIVTGRTEEAEKWLQACLRRRPDDPAVWKSRLDLALALRRHDLAEAALEHLDGRTLTPRKALTLRAWLAEQALDRDGERDALTRLLELEPGNAHALERLAVLSDSASSSAYRTRKLASDEAQNRYKQLLRSEDYRAHVAELAELAERLGRWFEARGWWSIVAREEPSNAEAKGAVARIDAVYREQSALKPEPVLIARKPRPASTTSIAISASGEARFEDEAEVASLQFVHRSGAPRRQLPQTVSGGVSILDYDGDGWLDVYAVQGGDFPPDATQSKPQGDRLFRNKGDGTFEDVTDRSGIAAMKPGYGYGAAVGDYDNDGRPDLFVTRWRSYALYRNKGDGTFEDLTDQSGLGGEQGLPTAAAWGDLDSDGDLDLYVCRYVDWDPDRPRDPATSTVALEDRERSPLLSKALPDRLYRNDGGRFTDVTKVAGIVDDDGRGLGVVIDDFDDDGRPDILVANDMTANYLFRNRGGWKFEEMGVLAGIAGNAQGGYQASMGIAHGDLDGDGRLDLAVTNFYGESTTLYRAMGDGLFTDSTDASGLRLPTRFMLGFGIAFFDFNNDGATDLVQANGHTNDGRPTYPYAMPAQLFAGGRRGRLNEVSDRAGPAWRIPRVGRGLAIGDLDNDGRVDVVILSQDGPLAYLRNRTRGGHFATFRLQGVASNRDAIGARVAVVAAGRRQVARRFGGGSYLASSDPRLHFGLGGASVIDSVEVRWPSGRVDTHRNLPADAGYLLIEGSATPRPLPGFRNPDASSALKP